MSRRKQFIEHRIDRIVRNFNFNSYIPLRCASPARNWNKNVMLIFPVKRVCFVNQHLNSWLSSWFQHRTLELVGNTQRFQFQILFTTRKKTIANRGALVSVMIKENICLNIRSVFNIHWVPIYSLALKEPARVELVQNLPT